MKDTLQRPVKGKTIVFTLGFDVTSIIARLSEIGLLGREHLVFIVPESSSPRALSTQKALENHITVLNARGFRLSFEFLQVEGEDASRTVARIYHVLASKDEIYLELSGGLRYLVLSTFLAAMSLRGRVKEVGTRLESDGRRLLIPLFEPKPLTTPDAKVLEDLNSSGYKNQRQLAASIGRKISNISRTLDRLGKMGFVNSTDSRPNNYNITPLGEVFLHDYKINNKLRVKSRSRLT